MGRPLYFCRVFFLYIYLFSSPNLRHRRLDVCHTTTHSVALVRIYDAGLKRTAHGSLNIQDAKSRQKSPSGHHSTILSGYIFAIKACIDNRKKIAKQQCIPTSSHNMVNFSPLAAGICWRVWDTPQISTGFASWQRYCTAFQYWASVKLCALNRGRHLYAAGRP